MSGKRTFIDTNVLLYCYADDLPEKQQLALELATTQNTVISTQVIKEVCNVLRKKFKASWDIVRDVVGEIEANNEVQPVSVGGVRQAIDIAERYQLQWFDSIIVATALIAQCEVLFSEDMHHGLVIEGMEIRNPFFKLKS